MSSGYFNYECIAREANISDELLEVWRDGFAREYPGDEMMISLRLLRTCSAAVGSAERLAGVARALELQFADNIDTTSDGQYCFD